MRQRGFVQLTFFGYLVLAGVVAFLLLTGALAVQTWRLDRVQKEYAVFVGKTEALGKQAQEAAAKQALHDLKNKERADAEYDRKLAAHNGLVARLRNERARLSAVPPAPAGSRSPDLAAFDRAELERAVRGLDQGVQGLVDEGSKATLGLDEAKRWAQKPR